MRFRRRGWHYNPTDDGATVTRLEPYAAPGVARDRLQAEAADLRVALRMARTGMWRRDLVTDALAWSAELHALSGTDASNYYPTSEGALSLVHPDDRAIVRSYYARAIIGGAADYGFRVPFLSSDRSHRKCRSTPCANPAVPSAGWSCSFEQPWLRRQTKPLFRRGRHPSCAQSRSDARRDFFKNFDRPSSLGMMVRPGRQSA